MNLMTITKAMARHLHFIKAAVGVLMGYGFLGLLDEIQNRQRAWAMSSAQSNEGINTEEQTSISDVDSYLAICKLATDSESIFSRFRSCAEYRSVLEHVTKTQGQLYLDNVRENMKIAERLHKLVFDDTGAPFRYSYSRLGRVSPTSLRYAKVLSDLDQLFGSLDNFVVSEIGIGFGGQCFQICDTYDIAKYELYDLKPVLDLASKYIHRLLPTAPLDFPKLSSDSESRDLVISNYAFSELTRNVQESYMQSVITNSLRGYITFNDITPPEWGSLTAQQFASRIPGAEILKEIPLTDPKNVLVVWGHKGRLMHQ